MATPNRLDLRPEAAEAIGVFFLVLAGCGAIMVEAQTGALGGVGVALTFAFVIVVLVYALAPICGAHYNPAITLAFAASGHFPWRRVPSYIVAQLLGAIAAAFVLKGLLGLQANLGATIPAGGISLAQACAVEALATFLLALVIIGVATDRRSSQGAGGLAIGLAVGVGALFAGPLTGGSMNPARSFGPAVVSGNFTALWVYLTAPVLGAVAAMMVYEMLRGAHAPKADVLGVTGPLDLHEGQGEP